MQVLYAALTDALFGADGSASLVDLVVHQPLDVCVRCAHGRQQVVVRVAVAQVSEHAQRHTGKGGGKRLVGGPHKIGDARDRQ
ncbi:hypothetical protein D3C72_1631630 [compost metagenome]